MVQNVIRHPRIPIVYDMYEDEGYLHIVMEYIHGITLYDYKIRQGEIPTHMVISILLQVCELLEFLQERSDSIMYLDLKPSNLMIYEDQIKLIDFGSAFFLKDIDEPSQIKITKKYTAPEQIKQGIINDKTCIYSIGTILHFLIMGNDRIESGTWKQRLLYLRSKKVEDKLLKIASICMTKNSMYRYSTIFQLKRELQNIESKIENQLINQLPKKIGVIGSTHRVGVTHLSLFLTAYIKSRGVSCIYIEYNNSKHIYSIYKYNPSDTYRNHVINHKTIELTSLENIQELDIEEYQVQIYDFGFFEIEKMDQYGAMDVNLGVIGCKSWEMDPSIKFIATTVHMNPSMLYLCNYSNNASIFQMEKLYPRLSFLRVPFFLEPIASIKCEIGKEFGEKVITYIENGS